MTNELIKISTDRSGHRAVSGRELHEFLGIETAYKDWFPRMVEYGFVAGVDFNPLKIEQVQPPLCTTNEKASVVPYDSTKGGNETLPPLIASVKKQGEE